MILFIASRNCADLNLVLFILNIKRADPDLDPYILDRKRADVDLNRCIVDQKQWMVDRVCLKSPLMLLLKVKVIIEAHLQASGFEDNLLTIRFQIDLVNNNTHRKKAE